MAARAQDRAGKEDKKTTFRVLITGANSGLGFALCCRLIDEFLYTRPQTHTLHLLFSTRSASKSSETSARLHAHLARTIRASLVDAWSPDLAALLAARIRVEGVQADLLQLASVKALAEDLLGRGWERVDAVVWNAGVSGYAGYDWPRAIWAVCTDLCQAVTYPTFAVREVGKTVGKQGGRRRLRAREEEEEEEEERGEQPVLGEVFTANVFGHYLLTHWLAPLLGRDSRVVWISSTGATDDAFHLEDVQGLRSLEAYESSKRLTDLLVLTAHLPSTKPYVKDFFSTPSGSSSTSTASRKADGQEPPIMLVTHPGVCATSISGLNWFLSIFMSLAFYLARFLGSPWHPIDPYKGVVSTTFAVLGAQILEQESREGKGKWGSATSVRGDERVARTEVEGWGYCGRVGVVPSNSVTTGLYRHRRETTKESREEFEELGRQVWREMEDMRREWEGRLGDLSVKGRDS